MFNNIKYRIIISIIIGIGLTVGILVVSNPVSLFNKLLQANIWWLLLFIITWILYYVVRSIRLKILLIPIKKDVKIKNMFWATSIGYMVNAIIPIRVGGEIAKSYVIKEKENIEFAKSLTSVAVERILDLLSISVLGLIGVFLVSGEVLLPSWIENGLKIVTLGITGLLIIFIVTARNEGRFTKHIFSLINKIPVSDNAKKKINKFVVDAVTGLKLITSNKKVFISSLMLSMIIWTLQFLSVLLIFVSFDINTPASLLLLGSMIIQLTFILPSAPGFIGTYEAYWALVLSTLNISNLEFLLATAIVSHILQVLIIIIFGSIALSNIQIKFTKLIKMK
mgnify:FL=1